MAILVLRFWRGFQAPSARFPRITTAVRAYQSLEHLRKWRWIPYPSGHVFVSPGLTAHWPALDVFEGADYVRMPTRAILTGGTEVEAWVYALAEAKRPPSSKH